MYCPLQSVISCSRVHSQHLGPCQPGVPTGFGKLGHGNGCWLWINPSCPLGPSRWLFMCVKLQCNIFSKTVFFSGLEGFWGQPLGPNFPPPWAILLALYLDCSTVALPTLRKVLPIWELVELKMLDFSDRMRTGISILTSAADFARLVCTRFLSHTYSLGGRNKTMW